MSTPDTAGNSLLGWLGLGKGRSDGEGNGQRSGESQVNILKEARRHLLDEISSFILENDLEVSADNLLVAHGAFSGVNPRLARQIMSRKISGEAITQPWLDEVNATDRQDRDDGAIALLAARLHTTLEAFSKNTNAARTVTSDYSQELQQHVVELEQIQETGQIISSLADLAKVMLERTRKVEQDMRRSEEEAKALRKDLEIAKRDAELDHLTGLPNRRAFEALLEREYIEAQASIEALNVAFCDIDNFKQINDTHGHDAGDRVIKAVAESLARISDERCHVARHGGEEFVMLFRGISAGEALERLDRIREQLAARRLINRQTNEPFGQVTFSGGVADVFAYQNPREALKAADEALYMAKQGGRNRIVLASSHK